MLHEALRSLAALPRRPGRFLLGPGLAGGRWLVGLGSPRQSADLAELLRPGTHGTVVMLGYELGRTLLGLDLRAAEDLALPRAVAVEVEEALAFSLDGSIERIGGARTRQAEVPTFVPPECRATGSLDRAGHEGAVHRIHEYLRSGDSYQVNLTVRLAAPYAGDPVALLAALCNRGAPACIAYLDLPGGAAVVSASPETLLRYDAGSRVASSLPIKGTRPRGADAAEDERLAAELRADPKEQAEHVMIVDLVRNDLGRVARTGSVRVPALLRVDRLPSVHHLVSDVQAEIESTLPALVASLFPAGSITGAPKRRSVELIDEVEPVARGPYCGSIGLVRPDGSCDLSVAIRTAVVRDGGAWYGAGGGITIASDAGREWDELLLKAAPFLSAVGARPPC